MSGKYRSIRLDSSKTLRRNCTPDESHGGSDFCDLFEFEIDRSSAAKDGDCYFETAVLLVDFLHRSFEALERAIIHLDLLLSLIHI